MKESLRFYGGVLVLGLLTISSPATTTQILPGHVPAAVSQLKPVGRLPGTTNLQLAIGLPLRNQEALTNLLREIYDPSSPQYRHYLTPEQFTREFGPAEADYEAVAAFAQANGLQVTTRHPNRMIIDVSGSVAEIERAFHITMRVYQHPTEHRTFYAPDREPSVDLTVPILRISGLDTYSLPRPRLKTVAPVQAKNASPNSGSGPQGTYMGNDFRAAYVPGTALTGAGQTVGILQFDGYSASDISNYEAAAGLPSVTLSNVLIDGFDGQPSGKGGEVEVSLDIEMAISMAPGLSRVVLYEGPNPSPFEDILNRMVTDNIAKQLSCSWYDPNSGPDPVADQIFQEMAAQGQSFLNASGDLDAWTGFIPFPGETPFITQVGGTTLTTTGAAGSWISETVWNVGNGYGSGGGISPGYAIPSWQTNVSMANNQGSTTMRNLPDVALTADNVYVRVDGSDLDVGGTSCAAPLWAGFMALVNQQAANNGNSPLGFLNPALYQIGTGAGYGSAFHDITTGDNTSAASPNAFFAMPGYDLCTGWGTPAGQGLIDALAQPLPDTPPSIITQPQSQTVATASNVVIFVAATGSPLLFYQWSLNGTNIDGATNALLLLPDVQPEQAGIYAVQITNAFGSLTSSNAVLTVEPPIPPVVVTQPQDQIIPQDGIAFFSVVVTGTPPTYQWTFNGNAIVGATNNSLVLFDIKSSNAGLYAVDVTNRGGWTVSSNAALTLLAPATNCESDFTALVGWWAAEGNAYNAVDGTYGLLDGGLTFAPGEIGQAFSFNGTDTDVAIGPSSSLNVGGTNGFTLEAWINPSETAHPQPLLEWGHPLVPENGLMLWISIPVAYGGNGPGSLVLDIDDLDGLGEVYTRPALIRSNVWQHVAATYDQTSGVATLYINGSLLEQTNVGVLSAWTSELLWFGYDPVSTNWGSNVFGEQIHYAGLMDEVLVYDRALSPAEIQAAYNAGSYGLCPMPTDTVSVQPANQTVFVGNTATFNATANGTPPLNFQWYFNGTNISGATSPTLTLTNVQPSQAGIYTVQASNALGIVLSSNAVLIVNTQLPPVITAQPTNQTAAVGNSVTFKVTLTGNSPLYYQWMFNGTNLIGATNNSLTLSSVLFANAGLYSVSITNVAGSTVSSNASLTVYPGWTQAKAPTTGWSCVASSADGTRMAAAIYGGSIYSSTDSGASWTTTMNAPANNWWSIVCSADGSKLAAVADIGSIYISTNSGTTWTKTVAPTTVWHAVTTSSDGNKLFAAVWGGSIYVSTNSGVTWSQSSAPINNWNGIAGSADGNKLAAVPYNGRIYLSTNSGATWTLSTSSPQSSWTSVASSTDGIKYIAAAGSLIYLSTNSGLTWTQAVNAPALSWQSVASSADGVRLVVASPGTGGNGQIYISADAGQTWRSAGAPASYWYSVASSANGKKLVAAGGRNLAPGQIYTWQLEPTLSSAISQNGLTLSWPQSWTGYILQENSDLTTTSWTDLPLASVLTNSQNQVLISPTNNQSFYRLKFP